MNSADVRILDLNDFEMPLYGIDKELDTGVPSEAESFANIIEGASGVIISLAEHNGSFTVAFKNIIDWVSRLKRSTWKNKKVLLLSTSPGKRGAVSSLNLALNSFPHWGADVVGHFSLPSFSQNFDEGKGLMNDVLMDDLMNAVRAFEKSLTN